MILHNFDLNLYVLWKHIPINSAILTAAMWSSSSAQYYLYMCRLRSYKKKHQHNRRRCLWSWQVYKWIQMRLNIALCSHGALQLAEQTDVKFLLSSPQTGRPNLSEKTPYMHVNQRQAGIQTKHRSCSLSETSWMSLKEIVHLWVSLWWIEPIAIDFLWGHMRSLWLVSTKLLSELQRDLHLPVPRDTSCLRRTEWLSKPLSIRLRRRSWVGLRQWGGYWLVLRSLARLRWAEQWEGRPQRMLRLRFFSKMNHSFQHFNPARDAGFKRTNIYTFPSLNPRASIMVMYAWKNQCSQPFIIFKACQQRLSPL